MPTCSASSARSKVAKVSGKKDEFGEWRVSAERHRVDPAVAKLSAGSDAAPRYGASTEAAFEAEIDVLINQAGNRLQQQLAKMRDHRDAGRDQTFLPGDKENSAV